MSEPTPAEYAQQVLALLRNRGFSDYEIRKGLLEMEANQNE
jgi:hypothetical protein